MSDYRRLQLSFEGGIRLLSQLKRKKAALGTSREWGRTLKRNEPLIAPFYGDLATVRDAARQLVWTSRDLRREGARWR